MKKVSPCMGCDKRAVGCHNEGACPAYDAYRVNRKAELDNEKRIKQSERDADTFRINGIRAEIRKNGGKRN